MPDFHIPHSGIFYISSEERRAEDFFFALKNPTASAGFEPANLGTKGQHATSRPPKPLRSNTGIWYFASFFQNVQKRDIEWKQSSEIWIRLAYNKGGGGIWYWGSEQASALSVDYSFHILVSNDQEFPCNSYRLPKKSAEIKEAFYLVVLDQAVSSFDYTAWNGKIMSK